LSDTDEDLKPFKDTKTTFLVDSVIGFKEFLLKNGVLVLRDLKKVPTEKNMKYKRGLTTIIKKFLLLIIISDKSLYFLLMVLLI
jgi:hypothetical protein